MPSEVEDDIDIPKLSNGDKNLVAALYNNESLETYGGDRDSDNIITSMAQYDED
jgi:hypothetical protein